ncbi:MAG TPA: hypothetical protein VEZ11_08915 [Thermoanaerobaculia bacterium]|nr:hypothetical protein [Thermoanaerobaculia bacterium]
MTRHTRAAKTVLILGGGGMVGLQVARETARELRPGRIVISALTQSEVDEAIAILSAERENDGWDCELVPVAGDLFIPQSLQGKPRSELLENRELYDTLFDEIFSTDPDTYKGSALFQIIDHYRPDVVVDCINTATAISYQDVFTVSRRTKMLLDRIEAKAGSIEVKELAPLFDTVRELLIAQGVPQITRHILFLQRALEHSAVRVYVKVGTTGTGGMGINIPYTHSEDKPSATLLSKSAIGFAHTGLLFLLARTPGSAVQEGRCTIVKEVKPGAMIGFKRLGRTHAKLLGPSGRREPGFLMNVREEPVGASLHTVQPFDDYGRFDGKSMPVEIVGADTGENGFFTIGEFEAITYPRQMEYVTPEEVARTVVLEILGASTGRDVLSAIDGAITEPSYRAGVLREQAIREMERLEQAWTRTAEGLPSIALGHLGPPKLSKLLIEAFLLRESTATTDIEKIRALSPEEMQKRVEEYLEANPRIVSLIATIGIPLLRGRGAKLTLTRGPRINIPPAPPDGTPAPLGGATTEKYARNGWVDLRLENFRRWRERIEALATSIPDIAQQGSAAFEVTSYKGQTFVPGDVVGWLLTNEKDEQGMVGHRLF